MVRAGHARGDDAGQAAHSHLDGDKIEDAMRVLLTGATGFIGSAVRARLLAAGPEVVAVARSPPPAPGQAVVIGPAAYGGSALLAALPGCRCSPA
jgi:hypothetical protein